MAYNKSTEKETIQTTVRIPKNTYEKVAQYALEDDRNVSKQINFMLKKYIELRESR